MPEIHPTATVDPKVELAGDVVVGPNCVLQGAVTVGAGTRLIGAVWLNGPVTIGTGNLLYPHVAIGFEPQFRAGVPSGAGVAIGDGNVIREGFTTHGAIGEQPTRVGNRNYLMANVHLGHDVRMGDECTLANGVLVGGHVEISSNVFIGGNSAIHQFVRLGRLAMVGGVLPVTQDVPPFMSCRTERTVYSLNLVGLRRAGLRDHIPSLREAFEIMYRTPSTNRSIAERIRSASHNDPLCLELAEFMSKPSKRGVAGLDEDTRMFRARDLLAPPGSVAIDDDHAEPGEEV